MQLIVLGMHRSGTSVLARLLNLMGAYFAPEGASTGANQENPKGFWERRDVRMLNDHVLKSVGHDWNRVLGFDPCNLPQDLVAEFSKRASRLVLDMDAHRPWLLKEPRLCLLFGLWRKVLEVPVCIHIHRHPVEVAASLHARNGVPIRAGLALWDRYVRSALAASSGLPTVTVSHRQLMQQPCETVRRLWLDLEAVGEAGLRMPPDAEVAAFVQRDLYRHQQWRDDLLPYRDAPQVQLFEELTTGGVLFTGSVAPLDTTSEQALAAYEASLPPMKPGPGPASPSTRGDRTTVQSQSATAADDGHAGTGTLCELDAIRRKLAAAEAGVRTAAAERVGLRDALNRAENAAIEAERRLSERFCETGELTRMLLEKDTRIARLETRQRKLTDASNARLATMKRRLDRSQRKADEQAARIEALGALLRSTGARATRAERDLAWISGSLAWKLGWPLRVIARWFGKRTAAEQAERREIEQVMASDLFDAAWYIERNPDVAGEGPDAAFHYLKHGALELRDPGPAFDTAFYLASNPDVAAAGINPLLHFIRHGRREGRLPRAGTRVATRDGHGRQ